LPSTAARGAVRRSAVGAGQRERIGLTLAHAREAAESQAERGLQLRDECAVVEGERAARRLRLKRPDDGRAPLADRQRGDRAVRGEALVGREVVEARRVDVRDDRVLPVVGDARANAEQGARGGLRAVGGDHEPRLARPADVGFDANRAHAGRDARDARVPQAHAGQRGDARAQGLAEQAVLDRVTERADALLLRGQDRGAEGAALGDVDAPDRRRAGGDRRPCADAFEHAPAAGRQRRRAGIEARLRVRLGRDRLDHDDVQRQLRERGGERKPDHAPAGNGDVAG
jgi:hypothetical protein